MICPKCKKQISDKTLKCNYCGVRVATICKKCNAYNSIYKLNCETCGEELLKLCSECKGVNFPNAELCRKCGHSFVPQPPPQIVIEESPEIEEIPVESPIEILEEPQAKNNEIENSIVYDANFYTQQKAKTVLMEGLISEDKKIISLSGQKGIGKSIVLKSAINELKDNQITWLVGECSAISQISPCGLIQEVLLTFFNVTNFCSDNLKLKKDSQKFFQSEFPTLTNEEIFNLLNFLYPKSTDYFENILNNKQKTFIFLEKVFKTIISKNKTVLIIDNFDFIDGMSYEFLYQLLNTTFSTTQLKLLLTYDELRPARGYLYHQDLNENNYLDVSLTAFDKNQTNAFITQVLSENPCSEELKEQLFEQSQGNPAVLEQFVNLLADFERKNKSYELELPTSVNDVMEMRLIALKEDNALAYNVLSAATIQGMKFYPSILNQIFNAEESEFVEALTLLQQLNLIMPVNEFAYAFKNSLLWETVLYIVKNDETFTELNEKIFSIYANYTLSSKSIVAIIAQNLDQKLNALNIWTEVIKVASFIGDTNLYVLAQKQCLVLVEHIEEVNQPLIKGNIYERLGKLLSKSNPQEAIIYLPNAILNAKKMENPIKEIELTSYLANCCIQLGDYFGTVECVDTVIDKIDDDFELEIAILKSRKLDALLNIGNGGEIINLVDNEIMPVFNTYLDARVHKNISIKTLYGAWLKTYLALANALVLQGNNRSFEVLSTLFEIFEKNNFDNQLFICKAKLSLAFANTIKGDVKTSEVILEEIIKLYKTDIMDNDAISRWNLINLLNNFLHKKYSGIKEELFQVVSFANNVNDHFTKNILKTLLGKLFKDEDNAKHALDIYSEQITYFAKEKNANGALLTWYLIAQADLIVEGPEKTLEVALKALEVAQNPKINNYFFIVLFNKIIAEAYLAQSEYESAKIHIEKAILVARKFELLDLLARLYLLYGKYLQDMALVKSDAQVDYALGSLKMYKKAELVNQITKNEYVLTNINKAKTVLNSFCQLNGIFLN